MDIEFTLGDITQQSVDALVNAANSQLQPGAGVAGAIHAAGGPSIYDECQGVLRESYPQGLPPGQAVATNAGLLPARWVIHTVGPIYKGRPEDAEVLRACHVSCLAVADELGAETVAFPAISTGVYGYPVDAAAEVAVDALRTADTRVSTATLVLFDERTLDAYRDAHRGWTPG
ncbi:MAG: O-acetyl-ADP-ribose deacetylase [Actinobacteria bacterium]|nr:O-acetyl-ADP-ribose deacetylase [Actinomycetota bacterium]